MCALAGILSLEKLDWENAALDIFPTMTDRGPDQTQYQQGSHWIFFHTLLQMQNASTEQSQQPVTSPSGDIILMFNGEIYNWEQWNPQNKFKSEAEFLASAWEESGAQIFSVLRGPFALAILNKKTSELFLIRDRVGEKPLYYSLKSDQLIFSSRISSILKISPAHKIKKELLSVILKFRYNPFSETVFEDISCVEPGFIYQFKLTPAQITFSKVPLPKFKTTAESLQEALQSSVKLQNNSIHRPALLLSGGVDSQTLGCLSSQDTIAFYFSGFSTPDEKNQAQKLCANRRWELIQIHPPSDPEDLRKLLLKVQSTLDEPILDFSLIPLVILAKEVAKKTRLVLVGDGADEIFYGYIHHQTLYRWEQLKKILPSPLLKLFLLLGKAMTPLWAVGPTGYGKKLGTEAFQRLIQILRKNLHTKKYAASDLVCLFSTEDLERINLKDSPLADLEWNSLRDLVQWEKKHWLPKYSIERIEKIFMAFSVEARMPYLDPEVINAAENIPEKEFFMGPNNKAPLRKIAQRYLGGQAWVRKKPFVGDPQSYFQINSQQILGDIQLLKKFNILFDEELFWEWQRSFIGRKKIFALWSLALFLSDHEL